MYDITFGELGKSVLKFSVNFLQLCVSLRLFQNKKLKDKNKLKQKWSKNNSLVFSLKCHLLRWGEMWKRQEKKGRSRLRSWIHWVWDTDEMSKWMCQDGRPGTLWTSWMSPETWGKVRKPCNSASEWELCARGEAGPRVQQHGVHASGVSVV